MFETQIHTGAGLFGKGEMSVCPLPSALCPPWAPLYPSWPASVPVASQDPTLSIESSLPAQLPPGALPEPCHSGLAVTRVHRDSACWVPSEKTVIFSRRRLDLRAGAGPTAEQGLPAFSSTHGLTGCRDPHTRGNLQGSSAHCRLLGRLVSAFAAQ